MPFTVSHVAAVLPATRFPLLRDPLILSAFAVGAMSPDVPYFVPFRLWSPEPHSWLGMVVLDVPITLALVALYWLVLAAPLRALAPESIRARLPRHVIAGHRATPGRTLALLVVGAFIGAATHIVWDAFTHEGRFGVTAVPWLQADNVLGPLDGYLVLQYVCSALGLALVAWSIVNWFRRTPASSDVGPRLSWRWQSVAVVAVLMAGALALWSVRELALSANDLYDVRVLLVTGVTRSVTSIAVGVLVAALCARIALLLRTQHGLNGTHVR